MNTQTMRKLDTRLGVPACHLLRIVAWLRGLLSPATPSLPTIKSILVIKFFGIGSVVEATPLLRRLRADYPQARIHFLTFRSVASICDLLPEIDETHAIRTGALTSLVADTLRVVWNFRRIRPGITFDLEFFSKFATVMTFLSWAPVRVGFYLPASWREGLLTHMVRITPGRHIREVFMAEAFRARQPPIDTFLEFPGIVDDPQEYRLTPPAIAPQARAAASALLPSRQPGRLRVIVNPNSSDLSDLRNWPHEYFAAIIDHLNESGRADLIMIGSRGEQAAAQAVLSHCRTAPHIVDAVGKTSIPELVALIDECDLMITNDSGSLHLALALDVPTLSLFGPETPALYGPLGDRHYAFYRGLYCSPCLNAFTLKQSRCVDNRCMKEILPQDVIAALDHWMESNHWPSLERSL